MVRLPFRNSDGLQPEASLRQSEAAQTSLRAYAVYYEAVEANADLVAQSKPLSKDFLSATELAHVMFNQGEARDIFQSLSQSLRLSKVDPTGQLVAFSGEVAETFERDGKQTAHIEDKNDKAWFVTVPTGVRWVSGVQAFVIGRITGDTQYPTVLGSDRDAMVVTPYPGTW